MKPVMIPFALVLSLGFQLACSTARDQDRHLNDAPVKLGALEDPPLDPGEALIKGLIRGETTRQPIEGVAVTAQSRGKGLAIAQQSAITDAKGRFVLVVPSDHYQVYASHCDYASQMSELDAHGSATAYVAMFLVPAAPGSGCRH